MSWVKLDDQFYWHPKVSALSSDAFRLFIGGLCLCNSFPHMAGVILRHQAPMLFTDHLGARAFKKAVGDLVESGLWEELDEGWSIHDYEVYQPVNKERREQLRINGGKGGRPRKNQPKTKLVSEKNQEVVSEKPNEKPARVSPVPSRPVPVSSSPVPKSSSQPGEGLGLTTEALAVVEAWHRRTGRMPSQQHIEWLEDQVTELQRLDAAELVRCMDDQEDFNAREGRERTKFITGYAGTWRHRNEQLSDAGRNLRKSVPIDLGALTAGIGRSI